MRSDRSEKYDALTAEDIQAYYLALIRLQSELREENTGVADIEAQGVCYAIEMLEALTDDETELTAITARDDS